MIIRDSIERVQGVMLPEPSSYGEESRPRVAAIVIDWNEADALRRFFSGTPHDCYTGCGSRWSV